MKSVTFSISCAEKYFADEGTGYEQLKIFWCSAARYGRLEIMKWAHREGYARVWSKKDESYAADNAVVIAAKYGQLDVLQWLRENGSVWNASTCAAAAEGGHLSCPQWATEKGFPCNSDTCIAAARGGHLPCIKWLREGPPW